uniref:BPTI/Kunitz inhibitor domain-containing protein n=1 Tax=Macrostomum lignano TaxID=282301 RepID=A0A1I8JCY4_9PLAT
IDYSQCFSKWLANDGYNCSEFSSDRIDYSQCSSKWLANDGYNCSEFSSDRIDYESSSKWIINRSKRSQCSIYRKCNNNQHQRCNLGAKSLIVALSVVVQVVKDTPRSQLV